MEDVQTRVGSGVAVRETEVHIPLQPFVLHGTLALPDAPSGMVLFAHGSGSSRLSPRNRYVASALHEASLGTLLLDLLTAEEEVVDEETRQHRFDIELLSGRLVVAIDWLRRYERTQGQPVGLFGASTGAAAALLAATERPDEVRAMVSRGGRPDLAGPALASVRSPTLFIVGGDDEVVLALNQQALQRLPIAEKRLAIVPGATHLFEEPGALEKVARQAADWFRRYLRH
jgi:putative phosphoribosyl transferase